MGILNIGLEKKNSLFLYGLHNVKVKIESCLSHITLINCTEITISYIQAPISGINILRCEGVYISEYTDYNYICTDLGYLDIEYSTNIIIDSRVEPGFTIYCIGSTLMEVNGESIDST